MKTKTLFPAYVKKFFTLAFITALVTKINGKKEAPKYYYDRFFKKKFEPTLKFESLMSRGTIVAADVVAVDSELPLKKRDSLSKSEGDIPKTGMKLTLRESEMNNIDIMLAQNSNGNLTNRILSALFGDVTKCIQGGKARMEQLALQALSTGVMAIDNSNNSGTTNRLEFAIPSANQYGAATVWSDVNSKPLDDIEQILDDADSNGDVVKHILMDRNTFNNFKKTNQVKSRYAAYLDLQAGNTITPNLEKVNKFLLEDYDIEIEIINTSVNVEKNGVRSTIKPWESGKVTFLTSMDVGDLAYGMTAEERRPVPGVSYQKADDWMLISKFSQNEPLAEFTSLQGYAVPVLNDVESIYQLNSALTTWS